MKKFAVKLIVFLIPLIMIYTSIYNILSNEGLRVFSYEYPTWHYAKQRLDKKRSFKYLIIGDSVTMSGLNPNLISEDIESIALGGTTPIEGYYMLEKYLEQNEELEKVYISYTPLHFFKMDWFWDRDLKWGMLDWPEAEEIIAGKYEKKGKDFHKYGESDVSHRYASYMAESILYNIKYPIYYIDELKYLYDNKRYDFNLSNFKNVNLERGFFLLGNNQRADKINYAYLKDFNERDKLISYYFEKIIALCESKNIDVSFRFLPVNESTYNKYLNGENISKGYIDYMQALEEKYENFEFERNIYYLPNTYFNDHSHLNLKGSVLVSNYFRKTCFDIDGDMDIFDQRPILTNHYNFTKATESLDENVILREDDNVGTYYEFTGDENSNIFIRHNSLIGNDKRSIVVNFKTMSEDGIILSLGPRKKTTSKAPGQSYAISITNSHVKIYGGVDKYDRRIKLDKSYIDGEWHQMVVKYDGLKSQVYLDGEQKGETSVVKLNTSRDGIFIGRWNDPNRYYKGAIGEVKIYNGILDNDKIEKEYMDFERRYYKENS